MNRFLYESLTRRPSGHFLSSLENFQVILLFPLCLSPFNRQYELPEVQWPPSGPSATPSQLGWLWYHGPRFNLPACSACACVRLPSYFSAPLAASHFFAGRHWPGRWRAGNVRGGARGRPLRPIAHVRALPHLCILGEFYADGDADHPMALPTCPGNSIWSCTSSTNCRVDLAAKKPNWTAVARRKSTRSRWSHSLTVIGDSRSIQNL